MDSVNPIFNNSSTQNEDQDNTEIKKLHPETNLGHVHLTISDMQRSVDFYQRSLGFQLHRQENGTAHLGAGGDDLLVLTEIPGAIRVPKRSGLYHFAILTPSRRALAKSLRNLVETETALEGGADHLVSEALYLSDPDGNGIEIYRDRDRTEWEYEDGNLKMGTEPLDYRGIFDEVSESQYEWTGLDSQTRLGHMHLHVANLTEATEFYEKTIGFDFLFSYMGSASFLSAGGYHHHVGLNIWNGVGAPPPPSDAVGMRYFTVNLVGDEERTGLIQRLNHAKVPIENHMVGLLVRDPSQNGILFVVD